MLAVSGQRNGRESVGTALTAEAARHDQAADRYEAMGDLVNARLSREHAVALRAASDAYERRENRIRALRAEAVVSLPPGVSSLPPPPPPVPMVAAAAGDSTHRSPATLGLAGA